MDFKIVFIDDNLSVKEPLVQFIRKFYKNADCNHVFQNPEEGLKFVLDNLNSKMLVFIDWKFDGYKINGFDLLKRIRQKTSLLFVVVMSANQLGTDISVELAIKMINAENLFYLDRSNDNFESVKSIIDNVCSQWNSKFDCILEQWLVRHPEDNNKEAFSEVSTGKTYTWADILVQLRQQTSIGKFFEKKISEYYIYQLNRCKK